jgi:outer membrane immunogenic protein
VRTFLLGATALIALTMSARAADLGPGYDTPQVSQAWSWSGCYVGGDAGGFWGRSEKWIVRTPGGDFEGQSLGSHDLSSWIAGVQGGCDYQFLNGFVIGAKGGYAWTDARGSHASTHETGVFYHSGADFLASAGGRMGYGWGRVLGYVTGGAAWEGDDYSASTIIIGTAYRASDTRFGWTVGVGGEYAFNKFLSGFVEYGHYDFGTEDIGLTPQVAGLRRAFVDIDETSDVVRGGLNLRFGG